MTAGALRITRADRDLSRGRLTLIRMFEELRRFGYKGGGRCGAMLAAGCPIGRRQQSVYSFVATGEACQFEQLVLINTTTLTVKVAHVWLCHS